MVDSMKPPQSVTVSHLQNMDLKIRLEIRAWTDRFKETIDEGRPDTCPQDLMEAGGSVGKHHTFNFFSGGTEGKCVRGQRTFGGSHSDRTENDQRTRNRHCFPTLPR